MQNVLLVCIALYTLFFNHSAFSVVNEMEITTHQRLCVQWHKFHLISTKYSHRRLYLLIRWAWAGSVRQRWTWGHERAPWCTGNAWSARTTRASRTSWVLRVVSVRPQCCSSTGIYQRVQHERTRQILRRWMSAGCKTYRLRRRENLSTTEFLMQGSP